MKDTTISKQECSNCVELKVPDAPKMSRRKKREEREKREKYYHLFSPTSMEFLAKPKGGFNFE